MRKIGRLHNLAERCIRKLTTQRNSMLHFGSDEGVEMAATYHSIISTVKLHGKSSWNFLGTFFKKIFNGCRDFICLTPGNIEMAVCLYLINRLIFNIFQGGTEKVLS